MSGPRHLTQTQRRVLSEVLQRVPLPLVVAERRTGAFIDANAAFLELAGRTWEDVVGQTARALDIYADPAQGRRLREALDAEGSVTNHHLTVRSPFGVRHVSVSVQPFDMDGDAVMLATIVDTTETFRAIAKLEESEKRFRGAFDAAATGMALVHRDGRYFRVNRAMCRITGYDEAALLATTYQAITHPDDLDVDTAQADRMLRGEIDYYELEKRYVRPDGGHVWVMLSVSLVHDDVGAPLYFVCQVQDITERKRAEDALRASELAVQVELAARHESERRFRAIFDHALQLTGLLSPDGSVLEVNETALAFGGFPRARAIGEKLWRAPWWPEALVPAVKDAVARAAAGELVRFEAEIVGAGERKAIIDFSLKPLRDAEGVVVMLIPEGRDVTDIKRAEQRLEASLGEKEILLKEIHHRVKNNMQVVSSLLQLQSRYTRDPEALAMFRESQDRIRSMALIHEKLYKTRDLARVDFADYLHTLGEMMSRSYGGTRAGVRIEIDADPAWLGVDTAIPIGLILNELVTNAMKHAYSESSSGAIAIRFRSEDARRYVLEVEDDGVGLPEGFSLDDDTRLGIRLLRILTGQVDGELTFVNEPAGTSFRLAFADVAGRSRAPR